MIEITCNNSKNKSVTFMRNGGRADQIMVFANQYDSYEGRFEYWFTVGTYKTLKNAKRAAQKQFGNLGYTFDPVELETLNFAD